MSNRWHTTLGDGPAQRGDAGLLVGFWAYCLFTLLLRRPSAFTTEAVGISVAVTLYLVVASGIQSVERFMRITFVIFARRLP